MALRVFVIDDKQTDVNNIVTLGGTEVVENYKYSTPSCDISTILGSFRAQFTFNKQYNITEIFITSIKPWFVDGVSVFFDGKWILYIGNDPTVRRDSLLISMARGQREICPRCKKYEKISNIVETEIIKKIKNKKFLKRKQEQMEKYIKTEKMNKAAPFAQKIINALNCAKKDNTPSM